MNEEGNKIKIRIKKTLPKKHSITVARRASVKSKQIPAVVIPVQTTAKEKEKVVVEAPPAVLKKEKKVESVSTPLSSLPPEAIPLEKFVVAEKSAPAETPEAKESVLKKFARVLTKKPQPLGQNPILQKARALLTKHSKSAREAIETNGKKLVQKTRFVGKVGTLLMRERTKAGEKKETKKGKDVTPSLLFFSFSVKELTHFFKRLAFLIHSGVPILESLQLLHKQTRSRSRAKVLLVVIADVANGQFLSAGLARFRKIFGDFAINVVRVGELSGTLSSNLTYLAEELSKRHALKRKLIGALIYPAFITIATIGISTLLTVYIFPKVMPIFMSLNVTLPFTTRALLFTSTFLRSYGLYVLGALILTLVAYFIVLRRSKQFHYFVSRTILRLPLFGRLVQNYNIVNFCRTLSLLLRSGFTVVEAATVTGDSTANPVYKQECYTIREHIIKGERISAHLEERPKLFPDMVSHMVAIGEKSGTLSENLVYLSEHYEAEVDDTIKNLSGLIEPVLMIFMGLVVGFVAVSVITPIYEVTQHLSR